MTHETIYGPRGPDTRCQIYDTELVEFFRNPLFTTTGVTFLKVSWASMYDQHNIHMCSSYFKPGLKEDFAELSKAEQAPSASQAQTHADNKPMKERRVKSDKSAASAAPAPAAQAEKTDQPAEPDGADDDMMASGDEDAADGAEGIELLLPKKKSKKTGSAKAKAAADKGKEGAKSGAAKNNAVDDLRKGLEEAATFNDRIFASKSDLTGRVKTSIDDYLKTILFARSNIASVISDDEYRRTQGFLTSLFLELSWNFKVALNGKLFKTYSSFRDESHIAFYMAHQKITVAGVKYDPLDLARKLINLVKVQVAPALAIFSCSVSLQLHDFALCSSSMHTQSEGCCARLTNCACE